MIGLQIQRQSRDFATHTIPFKHFSHFTRRDRKWAGKLVCFCGINVGSPPQDEENNVGPESPPLRTAAAVPTRLAWAQCECVCIAACWQGRSYCCETAKHSLDICCAHFVVFQTRLSWIQVLLVTLPTRVHHCASLKSGESGSITSHKILHLWHKNKRKPQTLTTRLKRHHLKLASLVSLDVFGSPAVDWASQCVCVQFHSSFICFCMLTLSVLKGSFK